MAFEVFQKGSAPVPTVPTVTIQKRGLISLNQASFKLLDEPEAVELLWDSARTAIGLRKASIDEPNAYPVRQQASKSGRGQLLIAGTLFTQYIGLETNQARRWVPQLEGEILVVDLTKPAQDVTSNRARRGAPTQTTSGGGALFTPPPEEGTRGAVLV